ncbi:MAG TPA: hypothetical protein VHZ95_20080, partial [Polyangiales bacterium]|nr:hypothetical protein [Polyangiales bacterium]
LACGGACVLAQNLFPGFVAAIRPLVGCDDGGSSRSVCVLPEDQYASLGDAACEISVVRSSELDAVQQVIALRGENIGAGAAVCDTDPSAWYPNDPNAPTKMLACSAACTLSKDYFPVFIAVIKSFLSCGGATK